jgi:hypothetical protein
MDKISRALSILFVFFLLAVPLVGCDSDSGMTLTLKIDAPKDGATVAASPVTVSGHVGGSENAAALVKINGADVPVKDHKFSTDVTLAEGKNVITIGAISGQADLKEQVTVTYAPAKK